MTKIKSFMLIMLFSSPVWASNIVTIQEYYQRISNMQKVLQSHQDKLAIK